MAGARLPAIIAGAVRFTPADESTLDIRRHAYCCLWQAHDEFTQERLWARLSVTC
jgi:hypothetical protein